MSGLTDIPGLQVGHASDYDGLTGCTVVLAENGAVAGGDIRGSATGQSLFHPQDLLAMGLILCGVASVLRDRWVLAGVLMGLALTSQQFSILVLVVLLVLDR